MLTDTRAIYSQEALSMETSMQTLLDEGDALFVPTEKSILRICGPDARAFLQRMSTNDMANVSVKKPIATCFLNNKGRIIDEAIVFAQENDDFLLISSFNDNTKLFDWLESFHFVEDFTIERVKELAPYHVIAQKEPMALLSHCFSQLPAHYGLAASLWIAIDKSQRPTMALGNEWQAFRIATMLAEAPGEINDSFMPQNVGLLSTVSETKGCYIGQEVIAKAVTYQKNVKSLAAFTLSEENYLLARVGMHVQDLSGKNGIITSLNPAFNPAFPMGLAVIETKVQPRPMGEHSLLAQFIL